MRAVVVGASSGLGRCIGVGLAQRGAQVALLARRVDKLTDAAKEAGPGSITIACDVTDPASVTSAIAEAAASLGGIDALVYTPGIGPLGPIEDVDLETWRATFDTNVIGASLTTAAALPHLQASSGAAVYLSSVSASQTAPWPGLGAYAVSKAALDKLVEAWNAEHAGVGFTRVIVGDCAGGEGDSMTEFANGWDPDLAGRFGTEWFARKYIAGTLMDVGELVQVVDTVLRLGASARIPSVTVAPRPAG
ncbi:MAG: short-chain dehydrogenase/reductase [Actinomycetia bacterium]|nr:short-chain dehydrogenase/reductase [Actinomycetes bacterium]